MTDDRRRTILKVGAAGALGVALSPLVELQDFLIRAASAAAKPPLPFPNETGTLDAASVAKLYQIIGYAGIKWQIAGYFNLNLAGFTSIVNLKTTRLPSYWTVYQMTTKVFADLIAKLGSVEAALEYLYTPDPPSPPQYWDVVRAWVIQEFLNLYITQNSFKAYGWLNYPGFVGGPYNDPNHLPYRGIENG